MRHLTALHIAAFALVIVGLLSLVLNADAATLAPPVEVQPVDYAMGRALELHAGPVVKDALIAPAANGMTNGATVHAQPSVTNPTTKGTPFGGIRIYYLDEFGNVRPLPLPIGTGVDVIGHVATIDGEKCIVVDTATPDRVVVHQVDDEEGKK